MIATSNRWAVTRFGRLAYRIQGRASDAPPLVLLHRFRGTMNHWDPALLHALGRRREVITFDSAGIGVSEGTTPDSFEGMAEVGLSLIDALELKQVDLLGWSIGGFVAAEMTLARPSLVRRLVIAGSGPGDQTEGPAPHPKVPEIATKPTSDDEDFLFLFNANSPTSRAAGIASLERIKAAAFEHREVRAESFMRQLKAIQSWGGVRSRLKSLTLPMLITNGMFDVMVPAYGSYIMGFEAPNARVVLYPDSGHGFLFQYVGEFADEVDRFLKLS
jgi:pimeloyl-ACP methyl ester carboxylesterase